MAAVWKHFKDGGWGMYVILFWSIITIGVIVERALYLYGSSINKDVFLATMQKCILAGDIAKAVKMCSAANAPLARIVQAGLVKVNRPKRSRRPWMKRRCAKSRGLQNAPGIWRSSRTCRC